MRHVRWLVIAVVVVGVAAAVTTWRNGLQSPRPARDPQSVVRRMLWMELQPVTLPGCTLERFGEPLKQYFHVANLHMNNNSCDAALAPFPAGAYEALFVNRRLAEASPEALRRPPFHALDRANTDRVPDCQPAP